MPKRDQRFSFHFTRYRLINEGIIQTANGQRGDTETYWRNKTKQKIWNPFFEIVLHLPSRISSWLCIFSKWIGFLIVISHCITPRHCQLEQQRPINTVIRCEGQTTRAAIMSSLKTQILFLPLFSFQLLSPEYNFLRVPWKTQGPCINRGLKKSIVNLKENSFGLSPPRLARSADMKVTSGLVGARKKESQRGSGQVIVFYIAWWLNITMSDEQKNTNFFFKMCIHATSRQQPQQNKWINNAIVSFKREVVLLFVVCGHVRLYPLSSSLETHSETHKWAYYFTWNWE